MAISNSMKTGNGSGGHHNKYGITPGRVAKYAFLPGIMPRIRRLGQHFGHFAFVLALVFRSARLLPAGHPMLNSANIGRFGITDVVSAAANNLVIRRENMDQIMIFGAILTAIVMIFIQAVIIGFYAVMVPAQAQAQDGMFTTADPANDTVLTFLQHVVGIDNFYNDKSPYGPAVARALHQMLGFYSTAMMVIAVIIVIYYVITVVGESAQSGTPFGRRFNGLWAPIRLVLALGLLVPLGSGLNAAQYIALYTAKFGSGLANNAWSKMTTALSDTSNLMLPAYPTGLTDIGKAVFLYETCMAAYNVRAPSSSRMSVQMIDSASPSANYLRISWTANISGASAASGGKFSCGNITLGPKDVPNDHPGREFIQAATLAYKDAVMTLAETMRPEAERYAQHVVAAASNPNYGANPPAGAQTIVNAIRQAETQLLSVIAEHGQSFGEQIFRQVLGDDIGKGGWGMAASYYIKIAMANETIQSAVRETAPKITPERSSTLVDTAAHNESPNLITRLFDWFTGGDSRSPIGRQLDDLKVAISLAEREVSRIPGSNEPMVPGREYMSSNWQDDNAVTTIIKSIFSVTELQNLADPNKQNVYPMVHMMALGGALIQKALYAMGAGTITGLLSGLPFVGGAAGLLTNLIFLFGFIGIGIGFVLYYILPIMPFIYFFFAIVEWGMSILEALIGAPLWALAHLRIEGDGMPGPGAMNGYIIMFGILIRPFLILAALIASYIMFNAGAYFLNLTFGNTVQLVDTEAANIKWAPFGYFGYLIVYAVIVYNLGLVCFKLIDTIPQQAMRWLGQSNLNFNDGRPDPIGNTTAVATAAGALLGPQVGNAVSGAAASMGQSLRQQRMNQGMIQALGGRNPTGGGTPPTGGGTPPTGGGTPPAGGAPPAGGRRP